MKKLLLVFLLLPAICPADEWYYGEIPWTGRGCDSFFATTCYDSYDEDVRFGWQYYAITEDELRTVYLLEMLIYDDGYLLTEPLHYNDYSDPELWNKTYGVILSGIDNQAFDLR